MIFDYIVWKDGDGKGLTSSTEAASRKKAESNAVFRYAKHYKIHVPLAQYLHKQGAIHVKLTERN